MKIAILVNTLYRGRGMDAVAEQQAKDLADSGHDVTIFTFDNDHSIEKVVIEKLNWPKKEIFNLVYRIIFPLDIFKIIKYSKMLRKYDVVISHFYPIPLLAYITKRRYSNVRYIFYDHGVSTNRYSPFAERYYLKLIKILTSLVISNTDIIISISKFVQQDLNNGKSEKMVIYNRVDLSKFNYDGLCISKNISDVCKEKCQKFLYVGIIGGHKGIELLIKSFDIVIEKYPDAKLLLVGKLSYQFNLYKYVNKENKNIRYLGKVSDCELGFLYDNIDVYLTASTWEGFNLPLVEAQIFGKPVVAFDIGSHKEVVKNGETGILVEPFNVEKFANAIIEVCNHRKYMGHMARIFGSKFSGENNNDNNIARIVNSFGSDYD